LSIEGENALAKIAQLKNRILFQSLNRSPDGQGGFEESWTDVAEVWAGIKAGSAGEVYQSQQIRPNLNHTITIRKLDGLNTSMRIKYKDRFFQIKGMQPVEDNPWFMEIYTVENVGS
jgi:SPP1 family predicted phage head-tail adaptor